MFPEAEPAGESLARTVAKSECHVPAPPACPRGRASLSGPMSLDITRLRAGATTAGPPEGGTHGRRTSGRRPPRTRSWRREQVALTDRLSSAVASHTGRRHRPRAASISADHGVSRGPQCRCRLYNYRIVAWRQQRV